MAAAQLRARADEERAKGEALKQTAQAAAEAHLCAAEVGGRCAASAEAASYRNGMELPLRSLSIGAYARSTTAIRPIAV
jgi:hypothetical protein